MSSKQALMAQSGAVVTRLLDLTLYLCEECASGNAAGAFPLLAVLTLAPADAPPRCGRGTRIEPGAIFTLLEQLMEARAHALAHSVFYIL